MLRKRLLLISFASIAALIAWGFAPGGSTHACASASSVANCTLQVSVNQPVFTSTAQNPQSATVTRNITNLPPCYQVTQSEVTFTVTRNNQPNVLLKKTITGSATTATVSLASLGANLAKGDQPNAIVAEVTVTATADPQKRKTESASLTL